MADFEQVETLYHEALARPEEERSAFLRVACRGNPDLLREVQSLLAYEGEAERLMEEPAAAVSTRPMAVARGTRLGRYEVAGLVGVGGMGEVYCARDTRLDRAVAIKMLSPELAASSRSRERLEHEARAVSSLNHPHICTLYDIGDHEGQPFMVMELLEGQPLDDRISGHPFPLEEAVELGIQLSDALSAAHARGILHRDLKPANIFLGGQGQAKVLDFGLAKVGADTGPKEGQPTTPGRIPGTVSYMSPEQARGEDLDSGTDLFSLGAVLYEVTTGRRAFGGATHATICNAILHDAPPSPATLNPEVPDELERIIEKCLEKDQNLRYQSAAELRADLWRLKRDTTSGILAVRPPEAAGGGRRALAWGAAVAMATAGVLGWWLSSPPPSPGPQVITPFTTDGGYKAHPRLSPDGERVAYEWNGDIYVKALGPRISPFRLTTSDAWEAHPAWSPDGRQIAFVRDAPGGRAICLVPSAGGQERKLTEAPGARRLSWSPDGEWLAFAEGPSGTGPSRIVRLSLATLVQEPLTVPPPRSRGDVDPAWSPDGTRIAFVRSPSAGWGDVKVWIQTIGAGEARPLTPRGYRFCAMPAWGPDGRELFFTVLVERRAGIWRVNLRGGEPRRIPGVGPSAVFPSLGGARMVFQQVAAQPFDIWRMPARGDAAGRRAPERFIASSQMDVNASFSPDGLRIAFVSRRGGGVAGIWACNQDGGQPRQVTSSEKTGGTPRWSPDGRRMVFDSLDEGDYNLYVVDPDGGPPRRLTREPSDDHVGTWSRDGRWIYFRSDRSGAAQIWKIPAEGGEALQVTAGGGDYAEESWDGRDLYYVNLEPEPGIWRVSTNGGEETRVLPARGLPLFGLSVAPGGLYFLRMARENPFTSTSLRPSEYSVHHLELETGRVTTLYQEDGYDAWAGLAVSPDERWLLLARRPRPESELMLLENVD